MLEHLSKVAENAKSNKMDAKNLAVVFGPVLLGEDPIGSNVDILTMSKVCCLCLYDNVLMTALGHPDGRFDNPRPPPIRHSTYSLFSSPLILTSAPSSTI